MVPREREVSTIRSVSIGAEGIIYINQKSNKQVRSHGSSLGATVYATMPETTVYIAGVALLDLHPAVQPL